MAPELYACVMLTALWRGMTTHLERGYHLIRVQIAATPPHFPILFYASDLLVYPMTRVTEAERERRVTEWGEKIMQAMIEHTVLHSGDLNKLMGKHEKTRVYSKGFYSQALFKLIHLGKIVEVSHQRRGYGTGHDTPSIATQLTAYYSLPAYAEVASWAKLVGQNLYSNAAVLLKMNDIADAHPRGWIHYPVKNIHPDFLHASLIRRKPREQGEKEKLAKHKGKLRYVRTSKFNTAVRVLKKVLNHRNIPY